MRTRGIVIAWALAACSGNSNFKLPNDLKGGFVVRCVGITDFAAPRGQTPQCIRAESSMGGIDPEQDGACGCAGGHPAMPPLTNDPFYPNEAVRRSTELAGAAAFGDASCHTVVADTCVPYVTPTDPNFQDFGGPFQFLPAAIPKGYVNMFMYAANHNDHITAPMARDFPELTNPDADLNRVARDTYLVFREYCNIAQWNVLTQELYGYAPYTLEWRDTINGLGSEFNLRTTHLNAGNLLSGVWADWPYNPPGGLFLYATHKYRPLDNIGDMGAPVPTPCNQGMTAPWGLGAVQDFKFPAYTANVPAPRPHVTGRIAGSQSVLLNSTSAALLTVSSESNPIPLSIAGTIGIGTKNCASGACQATLSLVLNTSSFKVHGYDVISVELRSNGTSTGVLQGDALAFSAFSGTLYARLADGRFDQQEITTGAVLARWDADQNRFVMAFSFDAELDNITATLSGTASGTFINTSPEASIHIASPASNGTHVECTGPSGTTVVLDASSSTDRQDSHLDLVWHENAAIASRGSQLTFSSLPLGTEKDIILMAYDTLGGTGEDRIQFDVVDTLAPDLQVADMCLFPPDHKKVCLDLFDDLHVRAVDQCDGALASSVKITNVTGDVVSWNETQLCIEVERDGNAPDVVDKVDIEATDSSGNTIQKTLAITIPHDLRKHRQCLMTNKLGGGQ